MSDSVKVSIVVPCYNQEKYVGECLAELGRQTLADIEIIAVDDGSTDRTREIISAAMQKNGSGIVNCKVAKNRHGDTKTIQLHWDGQYTRFSSIGYLQDE